MAGPGDATVTRRPTPGLSAPPLHPDCAPLAFLLGVWRGRGSGEYPTIDPFEYGEEIAFTHVGKPFLAYRQRTWAPDDDRPLHAETGYLRPQPNGALELVLAHPTGVAEVETGHVMGTVIELSTAGIALTPSAKPITQLVRRIEVDGDELRYELAMAAVGRPTLPHLRAVLRRSG